MTEQKIVVAEKSKQKTGVAVGKRRGFKTTKLAPIKRKFTKSKKENKELITGVIKEITGFSPYEKKILEHLKGEREKKARRLAKKRLGSYQRSKKKIEQISTYISEERRAGRKL